MKMYLGLTKRNMLVYFKDRQAILFSLLTSIILFVLYLLFLRCSVPAVPPKHLCGRDQPGAGLHADDPGTGPG